MKAEVGWCSIHPGGSALLQAGSRPADSAAAEADVTSAQTSLDRAQNGLRNLELVALFAGTVGAVHVRAGELAGLGQPLVTVGDLSTLQVETTDLGEVDVAQVAVGQKVTVTFDAIPGQSFSGQVSRISPLGETSAGEVRYTAVIGLDEVTPAIRWGMTARVSIEVK